VRDEEMEVLCHTRVCDLLGFRLMLTCPEDFGYHTRSSPFELAPDAGKI
jgi:hypothetical protein